MTSKIIFENLKIYAYHGVLPEEKILGTYYILNVEIHADLQKPAESDDLKDTINYAEINDILHAEMAISSKLLEHVCGRIIKNIKNNFPQIAFIKVKLTKTSPPMRGEMDGVSVEMESNFS
ncbi:dihydroneopterin aldolase [Halpernia humi]|uniref:7,8-dihydroneopterin aldolase n=1 Tax=Halpernia humi TaxID=493375 RepID=A0A1H5SRD1_9FLAO|nr:dihydroneopterin aldolase [Halpernia humi]SEF53119.1 dihydroneopterin aldolase [Halpernia humi]